MPDGSAPDRAEKNMTLRVGDQVSAPFSLDDMARVADAARGGRLTLRETDADREVRDKAYRVTAEELRSFIERWERLQAEKQDIADQQKEVMSEAKGRGYDTKIIRKLIALRKREPDDIAEEESVLEMYKQALGMP